MYYTQILNVEVYLYTLVYLLYKKVVSMLFVFYFFFYYTFIRKSQNENRSAKTLISLSVCY